MIVVLAHELHELAVHAENHEHLELLRTQERIALRQHVPRAARKAQAIEGRTDSFI